MKYVWLLCCLFSQPVLAENSACRSRFIKKDSSHLNHVENIHYLFDANAKSAIQEFQLEIKHRRKSKSNDNDANNVVFLAAYNQEADIMRAVLKNNVKVDHRNEHGSTPLHFAAANNPSLGTLSTLLKAGANPDAINEFGIRPLHNAVFNPNAPIICSALLKAGANPNARDKSGKTPLHNAVDTSNADTVNILLESGADPNKKDNDGNTPLLNAILADKLNFGIIESLMKAGARPHIKNKNNQNAWDIAKGNKDVTNILKKYKTRRNKRKPKVFLVKAKMNL